MIYNIYHLSRKVVRQRACPLGETAVTLLLAAGWHPRQGSPLVRSHLRERGGQWWRQSWQRLLGQPRPDGAAGKRTEPRSRWYGGMGHGMGRMFGLPDSFGDDTTPISADFYNFPDTGGQRHAGRGKHGRRQGDATLAFDVRDSQSRPRTPSVTPTNSAAVRSTDSPRCCYRL